MIPRAISATTNGSRGRGKRGACVFGGGRRDKDGFAVRVAHGNVEGFVRIDREKATQMRCEQVQAVGGLQHGVVAGDGGEAGFRLGVAPDLLVGDKSDVRGGYPPGGERGFHKEPAAFAVFVGDEHGRSGPERGGLEIVEGVAFSRLPGVEEEGMRRGHDAQVRVAHGYGLAGQRGKGLGVHVVDAFLDPGGIAGAQVFTVSLFGAVGCDAPKGLCCVEMRCFLAPRSEEALQVVLLRGLQRILRGGRAMLRFARRKKQDPGGGLVCRAPCPMRPQGRRGQVL